MILRKSASEKKEGGILQSLRNFFAVPEWAREMIGRSAYVIGDYYKSQMRNRTLSSIDNTVPDYGFWDRLRHGKATGYELAGLFAQPITQIMASWVLGTQIHAFLSNQEDAYTNQLLRKFLRRIHGELVRMSEDLYALGDQYVLVNPDGSLFFPSPELVDVERDLLDHRKIVKVTISIKKKEATITDTYTAKYRLLKIEYASDDKHDEKRVETRRFENLIGRIPLVHFANDRAANETHGRPIYEALFRLLGRYDTLLEKGLDGAELLGNPMPVFEEVDDIDEVIQNNASPDQTYIDANGDEHPVIDWGNLQALFVNGKFDYKSPRPNFTNDIREMLKVLFLLILEFTRIPEAVWGGELTSSRSTAVEQLKTFFIYIKFRRMYLEGRGGDIETGAAPSGGLLEMIEIWLRTKALSDPRVLVDDVTLKWQHHSDVPPDIRLKSVQWAAGMGYISASQALDAMDLMNEDLVEARREDGQDEYMAAVNRDLQNPDANEKDFEAQMLAKQAERRLAQ